MHQLQPVALAPKPAFEQRGENVITVRMNKMQHRFSLLVVFLIAIEWFLLYHAKRYYSIRKTKTALRRFLFWQGQKDLNPRHAVLETAALQTELYPYLLIVAQSQHINYIRKAYGCQ